MMPVSFQSKSEFAKQGVIDTSGTEAHGVAQLSRVHAGPSSTSATLTMCSPVHSGAIHGFLCGPSCIDECPEVSSNSVRYRVFR